MSRVRDALALALSSQTSAWVIQFPACFQQTNGNDCGVHAVANALRFIREVDPQASFNSIAARQEMIGSLFGRVIAMPSLVPEDLSRFPPDRGPRIRRPHVVTPPVVIVHSQGFRKDGESLHSVPILLEASVVLEFPAPTLPANVSVRDGLTPSTRKGHIRSFLLLKAWLLLQVPTGPSVETKLAMKLPIAMLAATAYYEKKHRWTPGTALKHLTNCMAFFARLDQSHRRLHDHPVTHEVLILGGFAHIDHANFCVAKIDVIHPAGFS